MNVEHQPGHGRLLGQIVLFLFTGAGILALYMMTNSELLTAVVCIALAEYLVQRRKWFGMGVEAALWIGALVSAVMVLPNGSAPESSLLFAAALAGIAGFHVRNPLFGAIAAFFVTIYLERIQDLGTVAALVIAAGALVALFRTWRRPSTKWLFIILLVSMPLAGWAHAGRTWAAVTIALFVAFAAVCLISAIVKRHRAMFAGAASAACVALGTLYQRFELAEEVTLSIAGAGLLLAVALTARLLRGRTRGFVGTPAQHSAGNPPESSRETGGGCGGAGPTVER